MVECPANPRISVIIAVHNGVETLQQCLDSVIAQSYQNIELIVIDGNSKDGTVELLETNQDKLSYWVSEPDQGIYNAWNKALMHATGEWVCFLGADDYFWHVDALRDFAIALQSIPGDVNVIFGRIMLLSSEGSELYPIGEPWQQVKQRFKQLMSIPHQAVMHRRSLFLEHGFFDESFQIAGDYELLLRELMERDAMFVPILVVGMRQGGLSSNPKNSLRTLFEIRRAQRIHGLRHPSPVWLGAVLRVYLRLAMMRLLGESNARFVLDIGRRLNGQPPYWTQL